MWSWELCQHWNTTGLLLLALNMISARIMWQLNRLYGMYLQCHWSLCCRDIFLSMLFSILLLYFFRFSFSGYLFYGIFYCVLLPSGIINDDDDDDDPSQVIYELQLSKHELHILVGLLTGHVNLNRHLALINVKSNAFCPSCQEEERIFSTFSWQM